jgi:hypothetical protein
VDGVRRLWADVDLLQRIVAHELSSREGACRGCRRCRRADTYCFPVSASSASHIIHICSGFLPPV